MYNQFRSNTRIRLVLDLISLLTALVLALIINNKFDINFTKPEYSYFLVYEIVLWHFFSKSVKLYNELRTKSLFDEYYPLMKMIIYITISVIIFIFFFKQFTVNRFFVFTFTMLLFVFTSFCRVIIRSFLSFIRKRGKNIKKILIVGAGTVGQEFYKTILKRPHYGYKVIGFLDDKAKDELGNLYIGKISDLNRIIEKNTINDVIVALPNYASEKISKIIETCEYFTKRVRIIPDYFQFISDKYTLTKFDRFPIFTVRNEKINELEWRIAKRLFDTLFSLFIIVFVFSWFFPLIIILIKLDSHGKAFFTIERWGRDNKRFIIYKFRSMYTGAPTTSGGGKHIQTIKNDKRVTRIGKYLRKFNLDELPQIFNVLNGEMSLVGPRPHSTPLNIQARTEVPNYMVRHFVKPGLTGWAQINGLRGETNKKGAMQQRIKHDIWYIENWSFSLDLNIISSTILQMIKGDPNAY